jgi:signal transduction histidine kinase
MTSPASSQTIAPTRSILVLYQAYSGSVGFAQVEEEIRRAVDIDTLVIYREFLDLNYFRDSAYRPILNVFLRDKYRNLPIEVIVAVGPEALQVVAGLRDNDQVKTPVVFAAVPEKSSQLSTLPAAVTGRTVNVSLANFVTAARALVPGLKHVALVGDPMETQTFREHAKLEIPKIAADLDVIDLTGLPMRVLKQRVASLPDDSAIIFTTINIDGDGVRYLPRAALNTITNAANRPVVVDVASYLGTGAAGGLVIKPPVLGREAGQLVRRILDGEDASRIAVAPSQASGPVFDWRALRRWKVSEAQLPPGSEILFREASIWERYRWQIVAVAAALVLQSTLIAALLLEDRARRAAQSQSFQLMSELAGRDRVSAVGEMSATMAHELRQPLAAIVAFGTAGLRWLSNKAPDLDETKKALQHVVDEAHRAGDVIKSVRGIFSHEAVPDALVDVDGLVRKVIELVETEIRKKRIRLVLDVTARSDVMVKGSEVQLQQVLLNVIMNAIEAMASTTNRERSLRVTLRAPNAGHVCIGVEDSGPGIVQSNVDKIFEPFFTTKRHGMGLGLSICRSIMEAHGGKLTVANGPSKGAIVQIAIPQCKAVV